MMTEDAVASGDLQSRVLAMARAPVCVTTPNGRIRTVSAFEARLLELGSERCRRRLYCEDFISLVLAAANMDPEVFNAEIETKEVDALENCAASRKPA